MSPNKEEKKNMKKTRKYAASLALGLSLTMIAPQAANAIIRAPLAQSDDQMSRNIVTIDDGNCNGTLIDKEWVITARHCLSTDKKKAVEVGSTVEIGPDRDSFETRKVVEVHATPVEAPGKVPEALDAALLKLDKPSSFTPAKVYEDDSLVPTGSRVRAYGWSNLIVDVKGQEQTRKFNNKVSMFTGKVIPASSVPEKNKMDWAEGVPGRIFYVRPDATARTVHGDSGGPLFLADGRLYGVLKGGVDLMEDADKADYEGYTPIVELRSWMEKVTGVDFSKKRNIDIQKKINSSPYSFNTPSKNDYAGTPLDETNLLKLLIWQNEKVHNPNAPRPDIHYPDPKGVKRDPAPTDMDIQDSDDQIPVGDDKPSTTTAPSTSQGSKKPDDGDTSATSKPSSTQSSQTPQPSQPSQPSTTSQDTPQPGDNQEEKHNLYYSTETLSSGDSITIALEGDVVEEGTDFEVDESTIPDGWEAKVDSQGNLTVESSSDNDSLNIVRITVKVSYPDGSTQDVTAQIHVKDSSGSSTTKTSDNEDESTSPKTSKKEESESTEKSKPLTSAPKSNEQKIKEIENPDYIYPSLAEYNSATPASGVEYGPKVDTGGSVEKEGFFSKIRNFFFG